MRVALYLRQSHDPGRYRDDEEGRAIDRQRAACTAHAERRGWTVDPSLIFPENHTSASKRRKRPIYDEMLRRIERGDIDVVVAWALDRLLRRPVELEDLIDLCEPLGVRVITVQGDLDFETPQGKLAARTFASMARFEADQKGERQHLSEVQAVEQGRPPRRRAFGYAKGGMTLVEDEAAAVRQAYKMLLAGSSLASIARYLNGERRPDGAEGLNGGRGLRTTLGREWEPTAVRKLLLSPRYAAIRAYGGEETGPGTWPAIVPEATLRQAEALLTAAERRTSGGSTARKWLGAGLFRCGKCDAEGIDSDVQSRYRAAGERIYSCRRKKHLTRLADPIDEAVLLVVEKRLRRPDVADLLAADDPEVARLTDKASVLRAKIKRIENDYGDGEISARVMREQKARRKGELDRVNRRLAAVTARSRVAAVVSAESPPEAFLALDLGARRAVIDALCRVVLLPGRPGRRPFDPDTIRVVWRA
ncbi:recombinase family protein [Geodermatophilus ruber]|uniref:Site-specific DNA recombinase n=1 Tax=Geodermatophilus ruber TaxID=504800 RepID=A0A1I3Z3J4_9ACTN|nr:recombinase family protein [Geodermatophilus ruber]SFK38617.1 Site-specific DNA recombinase [Geodermatophilus ruber]